MKPIRTWVELNEIIRLADEKTCEQLLKVELDGPKRKVFALRIHSRLNRVRAARERKEIGNAIKG